MAHSLALASTSSLRVPVLWAMIARRGPVVSISSNRWYSLAKAATGELSWAKNREAKEKERGDDPFPSLAIPPVDELIATPMANLKRCGYARVSQLNQVYDACMTSDDIFKAQKLLVAFRHSRNESRVSLPMVVVRACVRAGLPERALHYVRNKVQFRVYPSLKVYNILMNALLQKDDAKRTMAAYSLLQSDKLSPNGITYHLAARAALQLELDRVAMETTANNLEAENNSEDILEAAKTESEVADEAPKNESVGLDLTETMELSEKCSQLEPKLGTKTYRMVVTKLMLKGHVTEASELLKSLDLNQKLPQQTLFNLKLDLCISKADLTGALTLLETLCSHDNQGLGMPKEGLPRLRETIDATNNSELVNSLDSICTTWQSRNKT